MALPKTLEPSLTPDELTFLAEDEQIQIVPLFSMGKIRLLSVSSSDHFVETASAASLALEGVLDKPRLTIKIDTRAYMVRSSPPRRAQSRCGSA